jgi:hypothetical protein
VTAAAGSWVVAVDNVSAIPDWWSDALCRAVTGDGDVRRQLYSDGGLVVFAFRRVVLLNGIDLGAVRDDLADRLLTVELARIDEQARRLDADLAAAWRDAHPRLLGALLDLAVAVLAALPKLELDGLPRMADFARLLAGVDAVLGTDGLATYLEQAADLAADSVAADPVMAALERRIWTEWVGTAAELLDRLPPADPGWRPPRGWPADPRALTAALRRRAPSLRRLGWVVDDLGRGGKAKTLRWRLVPPPAGNGRASQGPDGQPTGDARPDARPWTPAAICEDAENGRQAGEAGISSPPSLLWHFEKREEEAPEHPVQRCAETMPAAPAMPADGPSLAESGSCARCGATCRRYGPRGHPLCSNCRSGARESA